MDIYNKYKSPLGYDVGNGNIDSYGVDHSNFSLRDEIEYQTARSKREQDFIKNYNSQGINKNYPQAGTNFWGSSAENNYSFGSSNISQNIQNVTNQLNNSGVDNGTNNDKVFADSDYTINTDSLVGKPSSYWQNNNLTHLQQKPQVNVWSQQRRCNIENGLLMDGMDVMYGMNRAINGLTFGGLDWLGNKFRFDSKMNEYLNLKDEQSRELAQLAGHVAEIGGKALTGGAIARAGYNQANMAYNGYKIGQAYDKLSVDPYQGSGSDIIARMRNHNGEPVILQRGEAIRGPNGNIIASGNELKKAVGTKSNYGLNKGIYKHGVSREDAQKIPRIIQQRPVQTNEFRQNEYIAQSKKGPFRVVTSPKDSANIIPKSY